MFAWIQAGPLFLPFILPHIIYARSLWLPFSLGIGCFVLIIPCILNLPETRPWLRDTASSPVLSSEVGDEEHATETSPLLADSPPASGASEVTQRSREDGSFQRTARSQPQQLKQYLHNIWNLVRKNPSLFLYITILLVHTVCQQMIMVLIPYEIQKFHVSLHEVRPP